MANNQTPKVTRNIPYRFVCEHCGIQTDWKNAHITGSSEQSIDTVDIPKAIKDVEKGNYFDLNNIDGKCEHCGSHQSWELGEAKAWMRRSPLMGLGLGGMIGGVGAFLTVFFFGLLGALLLLLALAVIGMIGAFIYGLVKYIAISSDVKKTTLRYIPELVWNQQAPQTQAAVQAQSAQQVQFNAPSGEPVGQLPQASQVPFAPPIGQPVSQAQQTKHMQFAAPTGEPVGRLR